MKRLNNCCCFSVRTGTLIIGFLGLIFGSLFLSLTIGVKAYEGKILEKLDEAIAEGDQQMELLKMLRNTLSIVIWILIIVVLLKVLIDLLLVVGVFKENTCMMMPYIVLTGVGYVCNAFNLVVGPMINWQGFASFILNFVVGGAFLLLGVYFWYCVLCHYNNVKDRNSGQGVAPFQPMGKA